MLPVRYALLDVQPNGARSVRTARSLTLGSLDLGPDNSTGQIPYAYERTLAVRVLDDSIHHRLIEGLSMRTNSSDIEDIIYGHRLVKVESAVGYIYFMRILNCYNDPYVCSPTKSLESWLPRKTYMRR